MEQIWFHKSVRHRLTNPHHQIYSWHQGVIQTGQVYPHGNRKRGIVLPAADVGTAACILESHKQMGTIKRLWQKQKWLNTLREEMARSRSRLTTRMPCQSSDILLAWQDGHRRRERTQISWQRNSLACRVSVSRMKQPTYAATSWPQVMMCLETPGCKTPWGTITSDQTCMVPTH